MKTYTTVSNLLRQYNLSPSRGRLLRAGLKRFGVGNGSMRQHFENSPKLAAYMERFIKRLKKEASRPGSVGKPHPLRRAVAQQELPLLPVPGDQPKPFTGFATRLYTIETRLEEISRKVSLLCQVWGVEDETKTG